MEFGLFFLYEYYCLYLYLFPFLSLFSEVFLLFFFDILFSVFVFTILFIGFLDMLSDSEFGVFEF